MDSSTPFKWLDLLEQEFDRNYAFVDVLLDDAEFDDSYTPDGGSLMQIRQRFSYMAGAFGQLLHKALTIVQTNLKMEAKLLVAEEDAARTEARCKSLADEVRSLRAQLAAVTSHNPQKTVLVEQVNPDPEVMKLLEEDAQRRMLTAFRAQLAIAQYGRLKLENQELKQESLSVRAECEAMHLTLRYLDKERAGRIQQIQLLSNLKMPTEERNRVWSQLETEIALQRCKTVIQTCMARQQPKSCLSQSPSKKLLTCCDHNAALPAVEPPVGVMRTLKYDRPLEHGGLGLSIVGGRDVALPIIISSVADDSPLLGQVFVGDLVKSANGIDLAFASRQEAVDAIIAAHVPGDGKLDMLVCYLGGADDDVHDDELINSGSLNASQRLNNSSMTSATNDSALDSPVQQFETVWLQNGEMWPSLPSGVTKLTPNDKSFPIYSPEFSRITPPMLPDNESVVAVSSASELLDEKVLQASVEATSSMSNYRLLNGSLTSGRGAGGTFVTLKTGVQPREGDVAANDIVIRSLDDTNGDFQPLFDSTTNDIAFSADV